MDSVSNFFRKECELCKIKESHELPRLFFRILQFWTVIITLRIVFLIAPVSDTLGSSQMGGLWFSIVIWSVAEIILAEAGVRLLEKGSLLGFAIGIVLSLKHLFSLAFILVFFGLYAF